MAAIPVIPLIAIGARGGRHVRHYRPVDPLAARGLGPRHALGATIAVAALAMTADAVMVGHVSSGGPVRPLAVAALAASLIRLALSLRAVHEATGMWRYAASRNARRA